MNDSVWLSVKVFQGDDKNPAFESELRIPLPKTKEQQQAAVEKWLDLMASGLRIGAENIIATLGED